MVGHGKAPVSIHALLAECDSMLGFDDAPFRGFNPRTPCGVRPNTSIPIITTLWIQSTHSLRSATSRSLQCVTPCNVSIHALLAECDYAVQAVPRNPLGFQSTHSLRSATISFNPGEKVGEVSIHALLAECDKISHSLKNSFRGFNPRTPCGVRLEEAKLFLNILKFQSTHSLRSATSRGP